MSRPKPWNVALRREILDVLRSAEHPLTTEEVVRLTHTRPEGAHERWHWRFYGNTYNQLRALGRVGLVLWHESNGWCDHCSEVHWPALWEAAPYDAETGLTLTDLAQLQDER